VVLKYLKDPCCEPLIVNKGLFEVGKLRVLPGTHHGRACGPGIAAQKHHLGLAVNQALILVLDGAALGPGSLLVPGLRGHCALIALRGVVHAFLSI
jgi:hypothetical protein